MHPLMAGVGRTVPALAGAGVMVFGVAAPAIAAGSGYGGGGSTGSPATGFSTVVTARTLTSRGGQVSAGGGSTGGKISIPRDATRSSVEIAITKGSDATVSRDLPGALKRSHHVLLAVGVEVRHGATATTTSRDVTVTLDSAHIKSGDTVVVFDSHTGRFLNEHAHVRAGKVSFRLSGGEAIAVLAPKHR